MRVRRHVFSFGTTLVLGALLITLCAAPQLLGQAVATGTVTGLITDESGAVVQGAKVELTDVSTGQVMSTITNDQGQYVDHGSRSSGGWN